MKLKELLEKFGQPDEFSVTPLLYGKKQLEPLKEQILQCEEFSECTELHILDFPKLEFKINKKVLSVQSYKLNDDSRFKGKCYLLSLSLTPEMYDPSLILTSVKDGAAISNTMYDPNTFMPTKKILLDYTLDNDSNDRNYLHKLLDNVLDNPEDYRVKGERYLMVRGLFEEVGTPDKSTSSTDLSGEVVEDPKNRTVFYMENEFLENGELKVHLKNTFIPVELADKFKEQFKDKIEKLLITKEEIDKFLEENKD